MRACAPWSEGCTPSTSDSERTIWWVSFAERGRSSRRVKESVFLRLASHSDISGSMSRVSVRQLSNNIAGVSCSVQDRARYWNTSRVAASVHCMSSANMRRGACEDARDDPCPGAAGPALDRRDDQNEEGGVTRPSLRQDARRSFVERRTQAIRNQQATGRDTSHDHRQATPADCQP